MNEMNNVVYGMINYGNVDISEGAKGSYEYIKNDIQDIKTRYIALGFHLSEFDRNEYYKEFGYSSLDSFVLANFNIDNKNLSRILSVYNKFGEPYKMFISEKYSTYSYSQLSEMVTLKEDDLKNITPAMTIRDIREYKKSLKKEKFRDVAKNEKVEQKVLTKQETCDSDVPRPFDERYQLITGNDLFIELMECLTGHIKNVDKVAAIVKLLNSSGL